MFDPFNELGSNIIVFYHLFDLLLQLVIFVEGPPTLRLNYAHYFLKQSFIWIWLPGFTTPCCLRVSLGHCLDVFLGLTPFGGFVSMLPFFSSFFVTMIAKGYLDQNLRAMIGCLNSEVELGICKSLHRGIAIWLACNWHCWENNLVGVEKCCLILLISREFMRCWNHSEELSLHTNKIQGDGLSSSFQTINNYVGVSTLLQGERLWLCFRCYGDNFIFDLLSSLVCI